MEWSIYNFMFYSAVAKKHLLYNSLSNMLVELNSEGYDIITKIKQNPNGPESELSDFQFLKEKRFLVQSNDSETNKLVLSSLRQRFNDNFLSLTIAPTLSCNFGCPYCYEKDKYNKQMSPKTQKGVIDFVKRHPSVKKLNITWYGGEPTTAIKIVRDLSAKLQDLVPQYSAYMITNGYHLDKIIDYLEECKIGGLQITLDGTKESHDKTRFLLNGKGTFDKIISNMDLLLQKIPMMNISVRMNISKDNSSEYISLFNFLKEKFPRGVYLYPAFVHNYTGCEMSPCYEDCKSKALFLKQLYSVNGIYTSQLYPTRTEKGCMKQVFNAYVIGPSGELYKCWHHIGMPEKSIGNIFDENIITNYSELANLLLKDDVLFSEKCRKCVLFPSCYGGCSDLRSRNEDFCIPAKSMLKEFLESRYLFKRDNNNCCNK